MSEANGALAAIQHELSWLRSMAEAELERLDNSLCLQAGLYTERENLYTLRQTDDFQAVFDKREPLVSVCIATYDRGETLLRRAIRSVRDQTYKNLQIIVVGDHCTDDTGQLVSSVKDSRIVFENLPQRGPYPAESESRWRVAGSNAMNRAIDLAEGDFLTHLDDDDEYLPERIEKMIAAAKSSRSEFLWHKFSAEFPDGQWKTLGKEQIKLMHVTTGSILYHRFFSRIKWDVYAYLLNEPGDWNRIRKIRFLNPNKVFIDEVLLLHHREGNQAKKALTDEVYLA